MFPRLVSWPEETCTTKSNHRTNAFDPLFEFFSLSCAFEQPPLWKIRNYPTVTQVVDCAETGFVMLGAINQ